MLKMDSRRQLGVNSSKHGKKIIIFFKNPDFSRSGSFESYDIEIYFKGNAAPPRKKKCFRHNPVTSNAIVDGITP